MWKTQLHQCNPQHSHSKVSPFKETKLVQQLGIGGNHGYNAYWRNRWAHVDSGIKKYPRKEEKSGTKLRLSKNAYNNLLGIALFTHDNCHSAQPRKIIKFAVDICFGCLYPSHKAAFHGHWKTTKSGNFLLPGNTLFNCEASTNEMKPRLAWHLC